MRNCLRLLVRRFFFKSRHRSGALIPMPFKSARIDMPKIVAVDANLHKIPLNELLSYAKHGDQLHFDTANSISNG